jgi:glycosyltransferase involved in cell wall biosynthesis
VISSRFKTVHITNYYHKNSGGISTSYNHLLEYADRHQRPIALIVPGAEDSSETIGEFARIYYVKAKSSPFFDRRYRVIMPWQFMLHGTRIREILLEEKPDLIEVCDKYLLGMLAAMIRKHNFQKLGRPLLVHFSCERMDDNIAAYVTSGKIGKWLARRMMGNYNAALYDFFIAVSAYVADEYVESISANSNPRRSKLFFNWCWRFFRAAKLPLAERIFICSRGGTNPIFSTGKASEERRRQISDEAGLPRDAKILLYAGRISPEKNIALLLELMERLKNDASTDYRLLVAGDGPQADWFRAEAEKRVPGRIKLLGHLTDKQRLAELYANCDAFIHPNPREPYGIGPLEAMASGIPVIAPNSGGILTYATQENAWLVEPSASEFAQAVKEALTNAPVTNEKIANALVSVRSTNWEQACEEAFSVYEQMLRRFRHEQQLFSYRQIPKDFDFHREITE